MMDYHRPPDHHAAHHQSAPPPTSHAPGFPPPTAQQPPVQIPYADPFHTNRDPFLPGAGRRGSLGVSSRAWPPSQGNTPLPPAHQQQYHTAAAAHHSPPTHPATHAPTRPPPPANGLTMQHPYDEARRRSVGAAGSPQYGRGPLEPPPQPPPYPARNMPPPSSPQNPPTSSSHLGSAPRGPPTASPFPSVRDLSSSHRPGMSISAILGSGEERKPNGSPHSSIVAPISTPKSMQPPSPGRARSASMRESGDRGMRHSSPPRVGIFGEPPRTASEPRRDNIFGSPQFRREPGHSFRAFQPSTQEYPHHLNGHGAPARPTSQPAETLARGPPEIDHREGPPEGRAGVFRPFGEPLPPRAEPPHRVERPPFHNGVTSHPQDRPQFSSPQAERERISHGPPRFQPGGLGGPLREESSLFRPAFPPTSHPVSDSARESIEGRTQDMPRQLSRPSPTPAEAMPVDRNRNGFADRPMTLEERQRNDMLQRGQFRKESDGSVHRAVLNISPDLNRKGRNSPLPQAVQGAQPRHIGPGGDNPGIKMEFGRMFSGLGSGVGSVTPNPHHAVNGISTPSRMSPSSRHVEGHDLVRSAVAEIDQRRSGSKAGSRAGRRNGRRSRDDVEHQEGDGRHTPDLQRNKRAKTNQGTHHHHHHTHHHPHHHHHHHVHELTDPTPGSFIMHRHPSNPGAPPQTHIMMAQGPHHHHHSHPGHHHHHHAPRAAPPARKPSTTVHNEKVINECASKPRKHLGSQLYTTEVSMPPATTTPVDARIKFSSKMKPIPVFQGQENCTFTVRVPRYYLTPSEPGSDKASSLEEICRHRNVWGTEIYTDDSDVVAAAVHSGWFKGDFGEYNDALREVCDNDSERDGEEDTSTSLQTRPNRPIKVPQGHDAHITVLILPPLQSYTGTNQHHIQSRDWKSTHDGMSYMIHSIDFVDEGSSSRFMERSGAARKQRIAREEANRRDEAAAGLLMFANGNGTVRVGA